MNAYLGVKDTSGNILRDVTDANGLPVVLTGRKQQTIQTHNAVSIPASGQSTPATWSDANGFDTVGITLKNDASTSNGADIYWSNDGTNIHGVESPLTAAVGLFRVTSVTVKARYFKLVLNNNDAAPHTMSAWAYLKG